MANKLPYLNFDVLEDIGIALPSAEIERLQRIAELTRLLLSEEHHSADGYFNEALIFPQFSIEMEAWLEELYRLLDIKRE